MAEFLRKKRFLKYNDSRCKKFLSKDFNRKCAYCKIREGDLAGPESFEKDHFFPIAKGGKDDYENLYYSCVSCNGKAGKSDTWSQTLLDPCKDDIWNVHIKLSENCQIEALTIQGKEYIRTFKLNRKSYVVRRRTIETQQTELREKLKEYEEIVAKLLETENFKSDGEFLEKDIDEWKHILDEGANYRMTKNAFDNEIDELIVRKLKKVGEVKEVDEDYDLLYELEYNGETFLCHVAMIDIKIEKTSSPKAKPADETKLGFGKVFSDHMFIMNYDAAEGWHDARIVPYAPIVLDPSAVVFHLRLERCSQIRQ